MCTFEFEYNYLGGDATLLKDGEPVELSTLTDAEKTAALEAVLKQVSKDLDQAWDRANGW